MRLFCTMGPKGCVGIFSLKAVAGRPTFRIHPPQYVTPELVEFVREKLTALASVS